MGTASTMTTGQFREFAGAILRSIPDDLNPTTAQGWIENQDSLRKALYRALSPNSKFAGNVYPIVYPIAVNYDLSVEDAIKAGKYDWANDNISSKNFPNKRKGAIEEEIILVHFNRPIESDEALRELDRMGYRPAELSEGLAFGVTYPDIQREFPVVVLGSVWRSPGGDRYCAYLGGNSDERYLDLRWLARGWHSDCRFAALRK